MNNNGNWNIERATDYLRKVVNKEEIPGATLGVVTKSFVKTIFVGDSQIAPEKIGLEHNFLYDLASLTKVVSTTTLTLKCIEEGLISLQTPISEILTDFPHKKVTIKQVLTHTSGICADDKKYKKCQNKEELKEFIFAKELSFEPGSFVEYSDFGFVVLGFVLEEIIGPIDEKAKEWIFNPLEMNDTMYNPSDKLKNLCVPTEYTKERGYIKGVVHDGKAFCLNGVSGNAGLFSTCDDLAKFVQMILNDGSYKGASVLSINSINMLKKCYTSSLNLRRTLGWFTDEESAQMGDYYSNICLFHTGFTGTSIYIDFKRECGIILLTNRIHPSRDNNNISHIRNAVHNLLIKSFDEERRDLICR